MKSGKKTAAYNRVKNQIGGREIKRSLLPSGLKSSKPDGPPAFCSSVTENEQSRFAQESLEAE